MPARRKAVTPPTPMYPVSRSQEETALRQRYDADKPDPLVVSRLDAAEAKRRRRRIMAD